MATAEKIIKKFQTYVDDGTELSPSDELDLLNKVYNQVWLDRPWSFSKKVYSNFINGTSISLPTEFAYILETEINGEQKKVIWIDNKYYEVVNFSDRRKYFTKGGYCWVDVASNKLEFTELVFGTLVYDYVFAPPPLLLTNEPLFPERFHHILYHLMAVDDYAIQQFDKAKSYAPENQMKADEWLNKMRFWDANLQV